MRFLTIWKLGLLRESLLIHLQLFKMSDFVFIYTNTIAIIKFSIYLCYKFFFFCLLDCLLLH